MTYIYRSINGVGSVIDGDIEAADLHTAKTRLKQSGHIILTITEAKKNSAKFRLKSNKANLLAFTQQLRTLIISGIPLDRALQVLCATTTDSQMRQIVSDLLRKISRGASISDAMTEHSEVFPRIYVSVVRAAEASGSLQDALLQLVTYLEESESLKSTVISALIYPAVLIGASVVSIGTLLLYVIPKFTAIAEDAGAQLPLSTVILVGIGSFCQEYWWLIIATLAIGGKAAMNFMRTEKGKRRIDELLLRFGGEIVSSLDTARFARTLGTLIKNGVPILQALTYSKETVSNEILREAIEQVRLDARKGKGIGNPLQESGLFPAMAVNMVKVGEETGQLSDMLLNVAIAYEKMIKEMAKRIASIIEPVIIIAMAVVVGFIVLSVIAAIFSVTDIKI